MIVHPKINQKKALEMLTVWRECGHDMPSLMKYISEPTTNKISLLISSYSSNDWFRLDNQYNSHSEAFAAFGHLIDIIDG